jgi:hypothetical protein
MAWAAGNYLGWQDGGHSSSLTMARASTADTNHGKSMCLNSAVSLNSH